ncbi:MAG: FKBP-type peptidyl-prolyl cis-trans isomerase [Sediminibacterium sp.]
MNKSILVIALGLVTVNGFAQVKKATTAMKPVVKKATATATANPFKNEMDSVSYSIGLLFAQNLKAQGVDNINMTLVSKALNDSKQNKKPLLDEAAVRQCMTEFQQKMGTVKDAAAQKENAAKAVGNRQAGIAFLAANGKRPGVVTLPDGLQYEVIKTGTDNTKPTLANKVKVHYHGTLINGTVFDSSVDRGEPISFQLGGVVKGWQEALQMMSVGSKWKIYLPADLAYGDSPAGPTIGPGSTLIFDVELLAIEN